MAEYVLVAGSRSFGDPERLAEILQAEISDGDVLVEGGARGVDTMARAWAESRGMEVVEIRADWAKYGRAAGPKRNDAMVAFVAERGGRAVYVWDGKSRGTQQCIESAVKKGVRVKVYTEKAVEAWRS